MAILRNRTQSGFTIVDNYALRDERLSLKAVGLLVKMLSLPDRWDFSEAGLVAIVKDGHSSVRSGLKELEEYGYLVRTRVKDESGRFSDCEWEVRAVPNGIPQLENHNVVSPNLDTVDNKALKEERTNEPSTKETEGHRKSSAEELVGIYNSLCPSLPRCRAVTEKRRRAARTFLKTFTTDDFSEICRKAESASFMRGENDRGWRADFDFLVSERGAAATLEGKYDDRGAAKTSQHGKAPHDGMVWKNGGWTYDDIYSRL